MIQTKVCPKCNGKMIMGDYTGSEIKWKREGGHEFLKSQGLRIVTYACEKCGYMESYVRK